ncbi:chalcone-flavanone isomerase family protein [Striga asiatica]|uniref:Chalcone-flavanone isomerase family protein n=1 Tax=Striga asiatica TaxID=4170 RepID=A0A5A7PQY9_STRAF|nr:chalcone-flavanone isomerase family protein [Striga asiatica]
MGSNRFFFIEPDGGSMGSFSMDPLLPQSAHWLTHIASMVDNSRHLFLPGSLVLQDAFNCMSKFACALVLRFGSGSNCNINRKLPGNNLGSHSNASSTQVKHISSVRQDVSRFFWNSKHRMKSGIPVVFGKVSSFALKQICKEAERLQCFPVLSLAAALVPPFTNISSNFLAIPTETSSVEAQSCMDRNPCEIENRICGPSGGLYFQNLAWDDNKTVEPRTGVEFPTMLGDFMSGESNSSFTPEVLVGTGSRTMTIIRIKTLKVYAFAFYVHPFDVCEKLGSKYACIPEDELNKCQDFYRDLLREDINMTIRLVINCNGIKINTVKDAFEKSLRARLERTNPHADFSCLQTFGSIFSQDIPLHVGTTINFRRTADGHLITEGAFFDMYIGEIPICEQTKEEIGKNVASIMRMC